MSKSFLFVLSGPSAVGKTTVAEAILRRCEEEEGENACKVSKIVTCTTRARRDGETDGVDYFFLTKEEFLRHKDQGDFAEFSEVYGNYYGVLLSTIKDKIDSGENALLVINWEGYQKIKKVFGESVVGIFLIPPSLEDLEKRIRNRGKDSEEVIRNRMKMIESDMQHKDEFDYCVENAEVDDAVDEILEIFAKY